MIQIIHTNDVWIEIEAEKLVASLRAGNRVEGHIETTIKKIP